MAREILELKKFIKFAARELGLTTLPKIHFVGKSENAKNAFGHSINHDIFIRITDRHPDDTMRTIAHELFHYKQNIMKVRKSEGQKEDEANAIAGRIMRKYNTTFTNVFKLKAIPSNIVETESAIATNNIGGGGIETYSPLLKIKMFKRKPLSDIIGPRKIRKELKREK